MKAYREGREDRAYLLERHGAGPREMSEGRSVEARQHDAEAPLQGHLTEHLRRRDAGGKDGADRARLVRDGPLRDAGLPQLQDLARRPGVDVGEFAFADLFAQGSLHCPAPDAPCLLAYVRTNRGMTLGAATSGIAVARSVSAGQTGNRGARRATAELRAAEVALIHQGDRRISRRLGGPTPLWG